METMAPLTILIADDDPLTVRVIAAALQKEGYLVVTAMDAMQALRAARHSSPAAIVMDVMMPAGSGVNALKQLKSLSQTQLIPVIAMSSSSDTGLPAQMVSLGAEEFLAKPVDLERLASVLRRLLSPSQP